MERKLRITVEGKQYEVFVEDLTEGEGNLYPPPGMRMDAVRPAPAAAAAAPPPPSPPSASPGPAGANDRLAPLGGVVVEVCTSAGKKVAKGDKVAVIEAMKQKTTVLAHKDGTVQDIAVKEGDAVESGQRMMSIV
ncbi:MAG: acetyl-CoA carboxylase biotin carboxyl carrier protein subunit [Magnetococcales bacterium]|nr:acetyl-CoA carboxylase biotin carboxyl carrier protein subunit [Magnetococcales bacterium]